MEKKLINIIQEMIDHDSLIGDDCASISLEKDQYLFSLDNFVENTHFRTDYFTPYDIGWKALAVNLSDIAAMAGIPLMALVGINLREDIEDKENWIKEFYTGMKDCAEKFSGIKIIGGDLCKSHKEISISITIIGKAHKQGVLKRTGAKVGDLVCVTGSFGQSALFLENLKQSRTCMEKETMAHLRPEPRIAEALGIWENNSRGALMDASDGLAQALIELAELNQVEILIDESKIPRAASVDLSLALYGGEDYELVGCFEKIPKSFTLIGKVEAKVKNAYVKLKNQGVTLDNTHIYSHF